MRKFFIFLFLGFTSCSAVHQPTLVGSWKPIKVSAYNAWSNKNFDLYNQKNISILRDSSGLINALDSNLSNYKMAQLFFKKDSTFEVDSYGLIIPTAVPGWAFGDEVGGKWTQSEDRLKLMVGTKETAYPFYYKILKHSNDTLSLGMSTEDYDKVYMTLEFVRK